jgi:hypothetical protein
MLMIKHIQVHSTATNIILCKLLLVYVISVGEFILIEHGEVILGYTTSLFDSRHVKFNCISVGFLTIFFNLQTCFNANQRKTRGSHYLAMV